MHPADYLSTIYLTQAFGIGLIAAILFHYQRLRGRGALLLWAIALLLHALAWLMSAIAHQLSTLGLALSDARHLASFFGLAFAYGHVALLFAAALALTRSRWRLASILAIGLAAALTLAFLSSFVLAQAPEQQGLRILLRVGLRDTLIGVAYLAVAAILARLDLSSRFGRRLLLSGFGFYGVALLMNAAVIWVDRFLEIDTAVYVPLNAILVVGAVYLGLGLIVWLMEMERLRAEAATVQVQQVRRFDALTGFPQREHFRALLAERLRRAADAGQMLALFRIGLDDFKTVNLAYGSEAGDRILVALGQRLREAEPEALCGRLEGDELALALAAPDSHAVSQSAARLLGILERPYLVGEQSIEAPASVGIALHPHDAADAEHLLLHAKLALKQAKREGGRRGRFFDRALDREARQRLEQSLELGRALAAARFLPYFQPIVRAADGVLVAFEALARWRHERLGVLPARDFLPMLEDAGRVAELDLSMLEQSCERLARFHARHPLAPTPALALNLSALTLERENLVALIEQILQRSGLSPRHLAIELTESRALADPERSAQIMTALRARGVQVWLDDFGTGHSNLAQLLRLPLDAIKLDRTLLSAAPVDLRRRALIAGAVRIARELGLATVAEGVETPEEIRFARDCGFALLQGHAIARPQAEMLAPPPAAELLAAAAARKIL